MRNLFLTLFFIAIFAPFFCLFSAPSSLEINYTVDSANQFTFSHYLENVHRLARIMMRQPASKQLAIKIIVSGDFPEGFKITAQNENMIIAHLSADAERLQYDYELNRKLIETILLARAGMRPNELKTPFPDWIITGLFARINPRYQNHILPVTRSPGLSALTAAKALPNIADVLTIIITEEDGAAARMLYEEFCLFTLDCVEQLVPSQRKVFFRTAELCRDSKISAIDLLQQTIIEELVKQYPNSEGSTDAEKMQTIFKNHANKRFLNTLNPPSIYEQEKRLNSILNFSYKVDSGSGDNKETELYNANLEQLPTLYRRMANASNTVTAINIELTSLANQTNPALKAQIAELININQEIIIGGRASPHTHSKKINHTVSEIRNIIDFYKKVETKLIELKAEVLSPADYFKLEISEIKSFKSIFPKVEILLNKYEIELKDFKN